MALEQNAHLWQLLMHVGMRTRWDNYCTYMVLDLCYIWAGIRRRSSILAEDNKGCFVCFIISSSPAHILFSSVISRSSISLHFILGLLLKLTSYKCIKFPLVFFKATHGQLGFLSFFFFFFRFYVWSYIRYYLFRSTGFSWVSFPFKRQK